MRKQSAGSSEDQAAKSPIDAARANLSGASTVQAADGQAGGDWMARVRERVAAHDLAGAEKIVDARIAVAPEDSDALGWRARLFAWTGKTADAEAAYRRALQVSPHDADLMLGLARVLYQQGRNSDALALLDSATQLPPARADVLSLRGRVLAALGQKQAARTDFVRARALEPANISPDEDEAAAGLRLLDAPSGSPRFEVNFGNETDTFNYTNAANAQMVTFVARPDARWIFSLEGDSYQRFGALAQKGIGAATLRFGGANSLTIAGGAGNADGIIPRSETYFEYGHGFRVSESKALRGIEFAYNQHWLWYEGAHVLVLTGRGSADLARDFRWTVSASGVRSGFAGTAVAWEPSGYSRLDFPLPRVKAEHVLLNVSFAVGTENFGELDQVGAFASRTFGGGARLGITSRQYFNFYAARQLRNGGNSETIYGASYGVRF